MYNCPHCKSENIQRVSLAYANGTKTFQANTVGLAGGEIGVANTSGVSQSLAAGQLAPPVEKGIGLAAFCGLLAAGFAVYAVVYSGVASGITALVLIALSVALVLRANKDNADIGERRRLWERLFVCNRCAQVFELKTGDEPPPPAPTAIRRDTR